MSSYLKVIKERWVEGNTFDAEKPPWRLSHCWALISNFTRSVTMVHSSCLWEGSVVKVHMSISISNCIIYTRNSRWLKFETEDTICKNGAKQRKLKRKIEGWKYPHYLAASARELHHALAWSAYDPSTSPSRPPSPWLPPTMRSTIPFNHKPLPLIPQFRPAIQYNTKCRLQTCS